MSELKKSDNNKFSDKTITLLEGRKLLIINKNKDRKNVATLSKQIGESIKKDRKVNRTKNLRLNRKNWRYQKGFRRAKRDNGMEWIPKLKSNNDVSKCKEIKK